jgi:hypothetical protein
VALASATGLVFSLAYLVKFNSLVVIVGLIAIFVFSGLAFKTIALGLAAATICALAFVSFFAGSYHEPRTGTATLNYDTSWILTSSMDTQYLETALGFSPRRWITTT